MIKTIQFSINRKSKSLNLAEKRTKTLIQHQIKLQRLSKCRYNYGNSLKVSRNQEFLKTPKKRYKVYSAYSRNQLNIISKKQRLMINNINHNQKNMKNSPINIQQQKGLFITPICFNQIQNSLASSESNAKNTIQTNMGKQNPFFPTFFSLKRPKYLSLSKKTLGTNYIVRRNSQRIQTECSQKQKKTIQNFKFENNYLIKKEIKRKKEYAKKTQIQNVYFPMIRKPKLHLR